MQSKTIDGNDPIRCYLELQEAIAYVRKERRPFLLEAMVSRLYGHSSASGANLVPGEPDCIQLYERWLEDNKVLTRDEIDQVRARWTAEIAEAARRVRDEPQPTPDSIWEHIYAEKN
jgi:2-oxoisovalerate dehydrogenase E1 component alpha subunit